MLQELYRQFITDLLNTRWEEFVAVIAGIFSVWYSRSENILVYPTGLINTIIYIWLSFRMSLFGEASVNLYYTALNIYGWYAWTRVDTRQQPVLWVRFSTPREWVKESAFFASCYCIVFLALTFLKKGFAPLAIPWADAFASASAYTGMWLMTKKKVESWYWWIATNLASIPLYFVKHYVFTSVYYIVLLIIAIGGLMEWRKRAKAVEQHVAGRATGPPAEGPSLAKLGQRDTLTANPRSPNQIKKIVVIGPESTGKSSLCAALAAHYSTAWVPEYAREYLQEHGMNYSYPDLMTIARGQLTLEDKLTAERHALAKTGAGDLLFIDTDLYVMKVWSEYVFGRCDAWILDQIASRKYDAYLLCRTDLPWVKDDLREYPDPESREQLFHIYRDCMVNQDTPWAEVGGVGDDRIAAGIAAVSRLLL
jgi:nicotinamide mononucleotide transporter